MIGIQYICFRYIFLICLNYKLIIIEMSRGLLSALSALTIVTGTAAFYFFKKIAAPSTQLIDRLVVKKILIKLRKRAYSTLREIAFIVNNIRTLEGDLQIKKISQIFMRDGGSGEKKLHAIEALVLEEEQISQKDFEYSCNHYCDSDIEIKILLQTFRKDLNMALQGVIESYMGPLPRFQPQKVLKMQQHILKSICGYIQGVWTQYVRSTYNTCQTKNVQNYRLKSSQEYLQCQGIHHEKQPNEKIFMAILEHYYRHDAEFKEQFEQLELDMEMFIIQMDNTCKKKEIDRMKQEKRRHEEKKSESQPKMEFQIKQEKQTDLQMHIKESENN